MWVEESFDFSDNFFSFFIFSFEEVKSFHLVQHQNQIGSGLGQEAIVEAAGPDCIVPGQTPPIKLLGLKVLFFFPPLSMLF